MKSLLFPHPPNSKSLDVCHTSPYWDAGFSLVQLSSSSERESQRAAAGAATGAAVGEAGGAAAGAAAGAVAGGCSGGCSGRCSGGQVQRPAGAAAAAGRCSGGGGQVWQRMQWRAGAGAVLGGCSGGCSGGCCRSEFSQVPSDGTQDIPLCHCGLQTTEPQRAVSGDRSPFLYSMSEVSACLGDGRGHTLADSTMFYLVCLEHKKLNSSKILAKPLLTRPFPPACSLHISIVTKNF